jgi:hypothetical protein
MHTEGHDMGRDTADSSTPGSQFDADNPGYELTDVNAGGIAVFLGGLAGFLVMFFVLCYFIGILINGLLEKWDGPATKWTIAAGAVPPGKGKDLESNFEGEQKQLGEMTATFPQPRLQMDDGNQDTYELHAREDLLLEHYTSVDGEPGKVRIPIERAMELIAQRGLPVASSSAGGGQAFVGDSKAVVQAPLTTGFARTGYELNEIEAREQQMNYGKAAAAHPETAAPK